MRLHFEMCNLPSHLAGEAGMRRMTDEGAVSTSPAVGLSHADRAPSSAPSAHLLPQREKEEIIEVLK